MTVSLSHAQCHPVTLYVHTHSIISHNELIFYIFSLLEVNKINIVLTQFNMPFVQKMM